MIEQKWDGDYVLRAFVIGEYEEFLPGEKEEVQPTDRISKTLDSPEFYVTRVENGEIYGQFIN